MEVANAYIITSDNQLHDETLVPEFLKPNISKREDWNRLQYRLAGSDNMVLIELGDVFFIDFLSEEETANGFSYNIVLKNGISEAALAIKHEIVLRK